ncbi:hypothetical protein GT045_22010 [Streptomyces sp. SID486]|uniref:hypothetical protein n=1 Tax=Streptomyces sp. SID486 TaxID=2690264 RepID=UPI001370CE4D|nr:hypothetical protein [Streptomyces sp. SID486]MYX97417.1 hypothetical protein [Streptomyces sp. SID486]
MEENPEDPARADILRATLQEQLSADPAFMGQLRGALAGPPPSYPPHHATGSIVVGSSRVRGSHFSLGPLTISHTRNSSGSWFAIIVLALLVLVLAVYGGVKLVTGEGPSSPDSAPETKRVVLKDATRTQEVLPGLGSLPTGWSVKDGSPREMSCPAEGTGCEGTLVSASAEYITDGSPDIVVIELRSYGTVEAASVGYQAMAQQQKNRGENGLDPLSLPGVGGDESMAVSWAIHPNPTEPDMTEATGATSVLRVGTLTATVLLRDEGAGGTSLDVLQALTAAMAARAGEAITGQRPTAAVQL